MGYPTDDQFEEARKHREPPRRRYSAPFQRLINKCKETKWILTKEKNKIRLESDGVTCPLSYATGQTGLCGPVVAITQFGGFPRPLDNGWTISRAADFDDRYLTALEIRVRAALIKELVEAE
jgi:hypothetical protein